MGTPVSGGASIAVVLNRILDHEADPQRATRPAAEQILLRPLGHPGRPRVTRPEVRPNAGVVT